MRARKILLKLFLVSITVNAILGIWALLVEDFGETQGKILATSFLVSAAMLSALVNAPSMGRRVLWPAPPVGAVAGASGFGLFIALLWAEPDGPFWFKLAGSLLVVAAGATLSSSLALIGLADRFSLLSRMAFGLIALLASTVLVAIWAEVDQDWMGRLIGIEAVLVAAFTLTIPAVSRFGPQARSPVVASTRAVRFCPSCGRPVTERPSGSGQVSSCQACGFRFEVVVLRSNGSSEAAVDPLPRPASNPTGDQIRL